jgi:voltage-dependent calcium channel T type alpha-1G
MFFIFMLAILSCTLFAGQFWYCDTEHLNMDDYMMKNGIITRYDCLSYGGEWVNPDFEFDNCMTSMLSLLGIQSTEGWVDTMWLMIDIEGQELQPIRDSKRYYCVFAVASTSLMTLLFLNLFVGVVIESFNKEKEDLLLNNLLKKVE